MSKLLQAKAAAETQWNTAAKAAFDHVATESGKTTGRIAADMGLHQMTVERMLNDSNEVRWSLDAVLLLAAATDQDPIRMLARESLP